MPSGQSFLNKPAHMSFLVCGHQGTGKTRFALQFPGCYFMCADPNGIDILREPENFKLQKNLIFYENVYNESQDKITALFNKEEPSVIQSRMDEICAIAQMETCDRPRQLSIYEIIEHAKFMARQGQVATFVLDGFNYFFKIVKDYLWTNEETRILTSNKELDIRRMYGNLELWFAKFVGTDLVKLLDDPGMNLIINLHVMRESEDVVLGEVKPKNPTEAQKARAVLITSDIAPDVEGKTRKTISGRMGNVIYMVNHLIYDKDKPDNQSLNHLAYCNQAYVKAYDTVVDAKNHIGLPQVVLLNGRSFYGIIKGLRSGKLGVVDGKIKPLSNAQQITDDNNEVAS